VTDLVKISLESGRFDLIGHDNPAGVYPSLVVPIGRVKSRLVAVHGSSSENIPTLVPIAEESRYIHHDPGLRRLLGGFDCRWEELFAYSEDDVISFSVTERSEFYRSLLLKGGAKNLIRKERPWHRLQWKGAGQMSPFYRLSLAGDTKDLSIILDTLSDCIREMERLAPQFSSDWQRQVRGELQDSDPELFQSLYRFAARGYYPTKGDAATIRAFLGLNPDFLIPLLHKEVTDRRYGSARHGLQRFLSDALTSFVHDLGAHTYSGISDGACNDVKTTLRFITHEFGDDRNPELYEIKNLMPAFGAVYSEWNERFDSKTPEAALYRASKARQLSAIRRSMVKSIRETQSISGLSYNFVNGLYGPMQQLSSIAPELFPEMSRAIERWRRPQFSRDKRATG
jgi:hypothetical protein